MVIGRVRGSGKVGALKGVEMGVKGIVLLLRRMRIPYRHQSRDRESVCASVREIGRERGRERERERERERDLNTTKKFRKKNTEGEAPWRAVKMTDKGAFVETFDSTEPTIASLKEMRY